VDLRGEPLFYRTQDEIDQEHEEWKRDFAKRKIRDFEKDKARLNREFARLPEVFQRRISWFRANLPNWRVEHEGYEMSACVDAVLIADTLRTPGAIRKFGKASHKKQRELVPGISEEHSGNSFGFAVKLAWLYSSEPLLVIAEHGAMTPLVGCKEYGCAHPRPADVEEAMEGAA
jgi:hypothetical protein